MNIIKAHNYSDGFRVIIAAPDSACDFYRIKVQQPTENLPIGAQREGVDGFRDCSWQTASTEEEALAKFDYILMCEARWHR